MMKSCMHDCNTLVTIFQYRFQRADAVFTGLHRLNFNAVSEFRGPGESGVNRGKT